MKRICKMCGKKYDYCPYCEMDKEKPKWLTLFHDENCNTIFTTLQKHYIGEYTTTEAAKILKQCDLSVMKNATSMVQLQISSILDIAEEEAREVTENEDESILENSDEQDEYSE